MPVYDETVQVTLGVEASAPTRNGTGPNGVVVHVRLDVLVPFVVLYVVLR
jgi:hypothetical protein